MATITAELFSKKEEFHASVNLRLTVASSVKFVLDSTTHPERDEMLLRDGIEVSSEALRGAAISGLFFKLSQMRRGGELPCIKISIDHIQGVLDETDLTIVAELASIALAYAIDINYEDLAVSTNGWKLVDFQKWSTN